MIFYYRKSFSKFFFGQNFFNHQPIIKIFAAHFRTNKAPNAAKIMFAYNYNFREIPLSESRIYTLIPGAVDRV